MKQLFMLSVVIILSGCSLFQKESIEIVNTEPVEDVFHPPLPRAIPPIDIEFVILTPETIKKQPPNYVFVALTWEDYLTLGGYMQDIKGRFIDYVNLLCFYRTEIEDEICKTVNQK